MFRLREPNAPFLTNMLVGILPRATAAEPSKAGPVPIGSGPFQVVENRDGSVVRLRAFDGYYGGRPQIDGIVFRYVAEPALRVLELEKGTIDFLENDLIPEFIPALRQDRELKVMAAPGINCSYLGMNLHHPALAKRQVRQAIAHAIDRGSIQSLILRDTATLADTILAPELTGADPELHGPAYDPTRARKLLDEAGYPDPDGAGPKPRLELVYRTSTDKLRLRIAEVIRRNLGEVGIQVQIQSYEFGTLMNDIRTGNFELYSLTWVGLAEPDGLYNIFHSSAVPPDGANRVFYSNPLVDRLLDAGRVEWIPLGGWRCTARSTASWRPTCRCCRCGTRTTWRACAPTSRAFSSRRPAASRPWLGSDSRDAHAPRNLRADDPRSGVAAAVVSFLVRRLLLMVPTVLGLVTLVFFFLSIVPGDPIDAMLGETAPPADRQALRHALGLDLPTHVRYARYLSGLVRGDLGRSIQFQKGVPVLDLIRQRFPRTAVLAVLSVVLSLGVALPLGILSAVHRGSWIDLGTLTFGMLGISIPGFWIGSMLLMFVSFRWDLLPMPSEGGALTIVLPTLTLGLALAGVLTRMTRAAMLDVLGADYVRTARAKGLPPRSVLFRHALRNALIPVVTVSGLQLGALLTGAVVTESIFSWNGLGLLTLQAIQNRDYPLVQGCVLVVALCYVLVNLAVDLLYAWLDPRIQLG